MPLSCSIQGCTATEYSHLIVRVEDGEVKGALCAPHMAENASKLPKDYRFEEIPVPNSQKDRPIRTDPQPKQEPLDAKEEGEPMTMNPPEDAPWALDDIDDDVPGPTRPLQPQGKPVDGLLTNPDATHEEISTNFFWDWPYAGEVFRMQTTVRGGRGVGHGANLRKAIESILHVGGIGTGQRTQSPRPAGSQAAPPPAQAPGVPPPAQAPAQSVPPPAAGPGPFVPPPAAANKATGSLACGLMRVQATKNGGLQVKFTPFGGSRGDISKEITLFRKNADGINKALQVLNWTPGHFTHGAEYQINLLVEWEQGNMMNDGQNYFKNFKSAQLANP